MTATERFRRDETASADAAVEFVLRFTEDGHDAGYTTAELEERVLALARSLGLVGVQVSATPTVVDVALGTLSEQRTYTLRVRPASVDLGKIAQLDDLVRDVLDGRLDAGGALAQLTDARTHPLHRAWPVRLAAYAVAGAALMPILGGGWREAGAAALVGLVVGAVALPASRFQQTAPILAPLAGIAASFCAFGLAHTSLAAAPDLVTLAALVTFLPGMTLTVGVRELASEQLQSGVANVALAVIQLLGLVFGVEIGRSIAVRWFGPLVGIVPHGGFTLTQVVAAVAAGLAFTVCLRARSRDAWVMCTATVLALVANKAGASLLGHEAGVFGAALAVGIAGGLLGFYGRRSPLVFIVPGVFMLVPGSVGFSSALQLLANQTVSGITTAFDTFVTAISIAYGLMIAAMVLPRRFTQLSPRR
jgi:uncharacterized membrane protein YjjP (DUF1212 family)